MNKALHYKDICLLPQYSNLKTRKDADVSVDNFGPLCINSPFEYISPLGE
mgnify:CR=1 FL=1